jgi:hypothetical protein
MKNVTLAIDEETLAAGREYAREHRTSINRIIRELLRRTVSKGSATTWPDEFLELAAQAGGDSRGAKWKREDLHRA